MSNIEEKLKVLRNHEERAQQEHLRAVVAAENALKEQESALKTLREEFDVGSEEAAKTLLESLSRELQTLLSEAETKLGGV